MVVNKQVGGYLISYNLQFAYAWKLEVIWLNVRRALNAASTKADTAGICITKAMNRPLAALWRRRQALVDIKSAPPAIPLDTPVTGMVLAREVQKKEKSSNYNFQDDGDTSSVPTVHV